MHHCCDRLQLERKTRSMDKCKGPHLGVTGLTLLLTAFMSRPVRSQQLQNWATDLSEQVHGTVYSTQSGANTSDLVKGWYVDPFPQDELAEAPAVVLIARGSSDVIAAVNTARQNNLTVAARGGGHWGINSKSAAAGITIDLSQMHGVSVDPVQQIAIVQGGALGGDILHEAALWGLSLPWGDVNDTGMGLSLGGGIGMAMRQHGLACDNILAAQIVIANGSLIAVSSSENPELLTGLRGAGTLFGIVTEVTFQLFDGSSDVYAGMLRFSEDDNYTIYRQLNDFTMEVLAEYPGLGIELFKWPAISQAGIYVNFFGEESLQEKAAVFQPLRDLSPVLDTLGEGVSSVVALNDAHSAFAGNGGAKSFSFSGVMTEEQFLNGGSDALLEAHTLGVETAPGILLTDWLGGAVDNTTSFTPFRDAYMHFLAVLNSPDSQKLLATAQQMADIMAGYATLYAYDNLSTDPSPEKNLAVKVGGPDNLRHLQYLKGLVDPENLFKNHQLRGLVPTL